MDEKMQIEKMACDMCTVKHICNSPGTPIDSCYSFRCAKIAVQKGYRKQSEGEWIDKPTGAYGRMQSWCSACGKHSGIGGIESNRHKPFCPNCGAKMKGVREATEQNES